MWSNRLQQSIPSQLRMVSILQRAKNVHMMPYCNIPCKRSFASAKQKPEIHMVGGKEYDDLKQFRLVRLPSVIHPEPKTLASIYVKRNIVFGSQVYGDNGNDVFVKRCLPILKKALTEAGVEGDQPQGVATLNGLSNYVRYGLENPHFSDALEKLKLSSTEGEKGMISFEAVRSVATQIPRQGHQVVGIGTYTDAKDGWTELAKEYAKKRGEDGSKEMEMVSKGEPQLFQKLGAVLVNIEYIGDENPQYWGDAGGAMARFFFL